MKFCLFGLDGCALFISAIVLLLNFDSCMVLFDNDNGICYRFNWLFTSCLIS